MEHPVQWTSPAPIWPALTHAGDAALRGAFTRPAILRFASDAFMDDFRATLEVDPTRIGEFRAQPETWRGLAAHPVATPRAPLFARHLQRRRIAASRTAALGTSAAATLEPPQAGPVLKLYQPAHQRYYLVAASLVCQLPGLPDRAIDPGKQERVTFVVRRLVPTANVRVPTSDPATHVEYAFITEGTPGGAWQRVTGPSAALVDGEDQQPLFPAAYLGDDSRRRKLMAGLVPVGKREAYMGAAPRDPADSPASPALIDPRIGLLRKQVVEPWNQLRTHATTVQSALQSTSNENDRAPVRSGARNQIQTISWYTLLDLAKFLETHIPRVWAALNGTASGLTDAEALLQSALATTTYTRNGASRSMSTALVVVRGQEQQLESVTVPYTDGSSAWPSQRFALAAVPRLGSDPVSVASESVSGLTPALLETRVAAALPAQPAAAMPDAPIASRPLLAAGDPGWFVIRCVYERPLCGPFSPAAVSEPSDVFQLAGFFDPDAPARPIRIGLPIDVSPAGLRKFDKNTAFMVSDMLCGHVQKFKGLTLGDLVLSVLPFPFHKDLPGSLPTPCTATGGGSLGMMCSVSIPIITICALILLMIIVSLLDIIFRWMPYFMICFPLPGFKAKENA
jgi:hypothetical protein